MVKLYSQENGEIKRPNIRVQKRKMDLESEFGNEELHDKIHSDTIPRT